MEKLLIVNNNMHIGGVQKALINLLWNIRGHYDITLLLFYKGGECLKELPPDINVITPDSAYRYIGMTKNDVRSFGDKLSRAFYAAVSRVFGRRYAVALMSLGQKRIQGYDVAISYLHNGGDKAFYGGCNDFVLNHVSAKKKIAFLHCDYQRCGANTKKNSEQYAKFDGIAACSQGCANSFIHANPHLASKVSVVYNCHRFENIRISAENAPMVLSDGKINVVIVARFGKEKGVERALQALVGLGRLKEKFHFHLVGDGDQRPVILQIIEEQDLFELVTLHGMTDNPYGYIKAADLLMIPSYSEAAPLVIGEAASLGTPILSTETSSAYEMLRESGYGWVCENSVEGMTKGLLHLVTETDAINEKKRYLAECEHNNLLAESQFFESLL